MNKKYMKNNKYVRKNKKIKNKQFSIKDLSILEILAILLIMTVLIVLISPIFTDIKDNNNKKNYINDVNTYVDRAADMYGNKQYKSKFTKVGNNYRITLDKLDKVNIDKDPYGFTYRKDESYIEFNNKSKDIIVNIKSCVTKNGVDYCYEIADVNTKDLDTNSIKTSVN